MSKTSKFVGYNRREMSDVQISRPGCKYGFYFKTLTKTLLVGLAGKVLNYWSGSNEDAESNISGRSLSSLEQ